MYSYIFKKLISAEYKIANKNLPHLLNLFELLCLHNFHSTEENKIKE